MMHSTKWDYVFSFFSWLIVIALMYAAMNIFLVPPSGEGPVAQAIGITGAQILYFTVYSLEGTALAIAKMFKVKKFRRNMLMIIYLTGLFTTALSLMVAGFVPQVIDNVVIAISAAGCWLYWKYKTEYVDPKTFHKDIEQILDS